ncbi:hypothetical protein AVEN_259465-1 [Araneus ventricosus]|uniref:Uncharacterized protein n=1 Tax=Araneus ventricosus TaxID=182803 RepID=A0A4Y2I245_ARAVE|nr:hypothetical protein AVEN_259465-1 [Araneus ventricosus]
MSLGVEKVKRKRNVYNAIDHELVVLWGRSQSPKQRVLLLKNDGKQVEAVMRKFTLVGERTDDDLMTVNKLQMKKIYVE